MRVRVNGTERVLPPGSAVDAAVRVAGADPGAPGVAAAVDGEVVPRERWPLTALAEGCSVEVVRAAAGG